MQKQINKLNPPRAVIDYSNSHNNSLCTNDCFQVKVKHYSLFYNLRIFRILWKLKKTQFNN